MRFVGTMLLAETFLSIPYRTIEDQGPAKSEQRLGSKPTVGPLQMMQKCQALGSTRK